MLFDEFNGNVAIGSNLDRITQLDQIMADIFQIDDFVIDDKYAEGFVLPRYHPSEIIAARIRAYDNGRTL